MPTPHNEAEKGQIAKTVLMPGDPLRAKFIAETFLTDVKLFNNVRGMLGYTGKYNGKEISVMGHGMGIPSVGIYSYELYDYYDVENIVRVGSAGGLLEDLNLFDVVLATSAYSPSTYAKELAGYTEEVLTGDEGLLKQLEENAAKLNIPVREGCVFSSDAFYRPFDDEIKARYKAHDVIAVEMEYFALCANARKLGKKAACILSISDNMITQKETTSEEREKGFTNMMKLALSLA